MNNSNQITDLRDMLFAQMRKISDPDCKLEKEIMRADALVNVSGQIINSIKVEVDMMRVTGSLSNSGIVPITDKLLNDGKRRIE